jgi:hypothetical protein
VCIPNSSAVLSATQPIRAAIISTPAMSLGIRQEQRAVKRSRSMLSASACCAGVMFCSQR